MSIDFAHIAPTPHLNLIQNQSHHLLLAHLVEEDESYRTFYHQMFVSNPDKTCILDNSAFEMHKQGLPMYESSKLIDMGEHVGANYIVMSDYPAEPCERTINAAIKLAPRFKEAGFGTFFVPQSKIGDVDDLIAGFQWAAHHPELVDYIGVSILAVPNAFGVERGNKLQRYVSRHHFLSVLYKIGILDQIKSNGQKIHMLGMVDGPNEIALVDVYHDYINTWDSSSAVWLGLEANRSYDNSPTGLVDGKFEMEVDFNKDFYSLPDYLDRLDKAFGNMQRIDFLCKGVK